VLGASAEPKPEPDSVAAALRAARRTVALHIMFPRPIRLDEAIQLGRFNVGLVNFFTHVGVPLFRNDRDKRTAGGRADVLGDTLIVGGEALRDGLRSRLVTIDDDDAVGAVLAVIESLTQGANGTGRGRALELAHTLESLLAWVGSAWDAHVVDVFAQLRGTPLENSPRPTRWHVLVLKKVTKGSPDEPLADPAAARVTAATHPAFTQMVHPVHRTDATGPAMRATRPVVATNAHVTMRPAVLGAALRELARNRTWATVCLPFDGASGCHDRFMVFGGGVHAVANKATSTGTTWAEVCAEAAKAPDVGDVPYVLEIASTKLDESLERAAWKLEGADDARVVLGPGRWRMLASGGGTLERSDAALKGPDVLEVESNMRVVISRPDAQTPGALKRLLGTEAMRRFGDEASGMVGFTDALQVVALQSEQSQARTPGASWMQSVREHNEPA
jgi:hypothetical protein